MAEQEKQAAPKLTELSAKDHADLRIDPQCALKVAESQHMINLKVSEVSMAISSFPVFMSRSSDNADWSISAINSFELGSSLFVDNNEWTGTHLPISMQTYPFFLMRKGEDDKSFTVGINEQSDAFSKTEGDAFFDEEGKGSIRLSLATAHLEVEIQNDIHTYQFTKRLDELGLIKGVDLLVQYQDGKVNTLQGLNTIDEANLADLSSEDYQELRKAGYIAPIYAMLTSIYQFNNLIQRHNKRFPDNKVAQVKLEVPKDKAAS
jgi:hypothetical protein